MRDATLHIGRHKSGTSSLQRALADSTGRLADAGILYPLAGRRGIAHHRLAGAFLGQVRRSSPDVAAEAIAAVREEIGRWPGRVVLSSEAFQNVRAPKSLHALLDPSRCDVVVYLREHYAYACSAYAQVVHAQRWSGSFSDYLRQFSTSYLAFLMKWRGGFVPRRLLVRPFDREAMVNGDIVDDFAAAADLPRELIVASGKDQNPSIGGALLEFKRAMNGLPNLPPEYDRAYNALSRVAGSEAAFRSKPTVPADVVDAFRSRFEDEMRLVVEPYPDLRVLGRRSPVAPPVEHGAADFHAVWKAIDVAAPEWSAVLRRALAGAPSFGDPVLATIAEASG